VAGLAEQRAEAALRAIDALAGEALAPDEPGPPDALDFRPSAALTWRWDQLKALDRARRQQRGTGRRATGGRKPTTLDLRLHLPEAVTSPAKTRDGRGE
jgi:hypothetical protein